MVTAVAVSRQLSYNVYDGILKSRNLPYLPDIRTRGHSMRAIDIMDNSVVDERHYLTRKSTYQELVDRLKASNNLPHLAVVDTNGRHHFTRFLFWWIWYLTSFYLTENLLLLGVVTRSTLEELIENYRREMEDSSTRSREWHSPISKPLKNARYVPSLVV